MQLIYFEPDMPFSNNLLDKLATSQSLFFKLKICFSWIAWGIHDPKSYFEL